MNVKPKKHLGQHFLKDLETCEKIAKQVSFHRNCRRVLEIGPGMGALTDFLILQGEIELHLVDIDAESIEYLHHKYPKMGDRIIYADFLRQDLKEIMGHEPFIVAGNFPYNISSQILFKCLEYRNQIPEIMGMFQREVAVRIAEKPGSKEYGILSVFMQAFYDITYCFTVDEHEALFMRVVKTASQQRRKTLRNSIKSLTHDAPLPEKFVTQRPERLSVDDFIELTLFIEGLGSK